MVVNMSKPGDICTLDLLRTAVDDVSLHDFQVQHFWKCSPVAFFKVSLVLCNTSWLLFRVWRVIKSIFLEGETRVQTENLISFYLKLIAVITLALLIVFQVNYIYFYIYLFLYFYLHLYIYKLLLL